MESVSPVWKNDWLYQLILSHLKTQSKQPKGCIWFLPAPKKEGAFIKEYMHIIEGEQGARADEIDHSHKPVRIWLMNEDGISEVEEEIREDPSRHRRYRFSRFSFYIFPDRKKILVDWVEGGLIGSGDTYQVEGVGDTAKLECTENRWIC